MFINSCVWFLSPADGRLWSVPAVGQWWTWCSLNVEESHPDSMLVVMASLDRSTPVESLLVAIHLERWEAGTQQGALHDNSASAVILKGGSIIFYIILYLHSSVYSNQIIQILVKIHVLASKCYFSEPFLKCSRMTWWRFMMMTFKAQIFYANTVLTLSPSVFTLSANFSVGWGRASMLTLNGSLHLKTWKRTL